MRVEVKDAVFTVVLLLEAEVEVEMEVVASDELLVVEDVFVEAQETAVGRSVIPFDLQRFCAYVVADA